MEHCIISKTLHKMAAYLAHSASKENKEMENSSSDPGEDHDDLVKRQKEAHDESAWDDARSIKDDFLRVWRIDNGHPKKVDLKDHGLFFDDYIYIVLKSGNKRQQIAHELHFWVPFGKIKSCGPEPPKAVLELSAVLNDNVILHREVEYYESNQFKGYFQTLAIFRGDIKSMYDCEKPDDYKTRLFHFKLNGKRGEMREVVASEKSLKRSDIFVLDLGRSMIQWNGAGCNEKARTTAYVHIENCLTKRKGKLVREFYDQEDLLPKNAVTDKLSSVDVELLPETMPTFQKKLLRLSDDSGDLVLTPIYQGRVLRDGIEPSDVTFIDTPSGLFVFIGPTASKRERTSVWKEADKYLQESKHPLLPIICIKAGQISYELNEIWDDYTQ